MFMWHDAHSQYVITEYQGNTLEHPSLAHCDAPPGSPKNACISNGTQMHLANQYYNKKYR